MKELVTRNDDNVTSQSSYVKLDDIHFEFTKDKRLLSQYFKIREKCYQDDLGLKGFSGGKDRYDDIGNIVIALYKGKVIGGARLLIRYPGSETRLTLEQDDFLIKDKLPELSLGHECYCECSRLAVLPEFRQDGAVCSELLRLMLTKAVDKKCAYSFVVSTALQARRYRIFFSKAGYRYVIKNDVKIPFNPIYGYLNHGHMRLSYIDLRFRKSH